MEPCYEVSSEDSTRGWPSVTVVSKHLMCFLAHRSVWLSIGPDWLRQLGSWLQWPGKPRNVHQAGVGLECDLFTQGLSAVKAPMGIGYALAPIKK